MKPTMKKAWKEFSVLVALLSAVVFSLFYFPFADEDSAFLETHFKPELALQSHANSVIGSQNETPKENTSIDSSGGFVRSEGSRGTFRRVSDEAAPIISAKRALVADLETGESYYVNLENESWPMASLTKMVTAAYAEKIIPADAEIKISSDTLSILGDEGGSGLKIGDIYKRDDLIKAMLLFSNNAAAEALASYENRESFIRGMRELAIFWGSEESYFADASGLSAGNQASPEDIRKIMLGIYRENQELFSITRSVSGTITELSSQIKTSYDNINILSGRADFIGGKTGFTDEAGENLASVFAYENRPVIIIVMGSGDRFGETESLLSWFKKTHSTKS